MSGFLTHYLFGEQAYLSLSPNQLKDTIKANIHPFYLGLQGPDIFFYRFPEVLQYSRKNIGQLIYSQRPVLFFEHMLHYLDQVSGAEREVCIAYLAGFLCHHTLDVEVIPYLYQRCRRGLDERQIKRPKIINNRYRQVETIVDTLLLRRYKHLEPSQINFEALICINRTDALYVSRCLTTTLGSTYNVRVHNKSILKAIYAIRKNYVLFQSNARLVKTLVCFSERIVTHTPVYSRITYKDHYVDTEDTLNESKALWTSPFDGHPESDASFQELLDLSRYHALTILEALDDVLSWGASKDVLIKALNNKQA